MIHIVVNIYIYIYIYIYCMGLKGSPFFSKVSHHLGVYFLRFVGLLYGEFEVKAYPEDHVCVCRIAYFGN